MVSDSDFLEGVKISSNAWEHIEKLLSSKMCLNCERHRRKSRDCRLCKKCHLACPRHKCTHCKEEFSSHKYCRKGQRIHKRPICLNCFRNASSYRSEPKMCKFCTCWAAWNGLECERCLKLLDKFGPPTVCEGCGKNSYFDKGEESRSKVGGLKLCFLCTYDFKKNDYYNKKRISTTNSSTTKSSSNSSTTSGGGGSGVGKGAHLNGH